MRLAAAHAASTAVDGVAERFANAEDFEALRLEPYLRHTARRHPALRAHLEALADAQGSTRIALVHGDVSPKNVLCGPAGPVLIDAECATFRDPAFDPAFLLNHLLIKSLHLPEHGAALRTCAAAFWGAYRADVAWESPDGLERRCAALIPALMLARVDEKSPLEYLGAEDADAVRSGAFWLFQEEIHAVEGARA